MGCSRTLNWAATVKIVIERKAPGRRKGHGCRPPSRSLRRHPRCTRTVTTATLARAAHAGANSVPFTGRIKGKALKPGHYVAVFTASNSGGTSAGDALTFTIVPR
jgi:hypothetical protein